MFPMLFGLDDIVVGVIVVGVVVVVAVVVYAKAAKSANPAANPPNKDRED